MKINAKDRRKANKVVGAVLKPTYFNYGVPINELAEALEAVGIMILQEDNTPWAGFFCGSEGECFLDLGPVESAESSHDLGCTFYKDYDNTGLVLTWYRMSTGKYEVVGYVS